VSDYFIFCQNVVLQKLSCKYENILGMELASLADGLADHQIPMQLATQIQVVIIFPFILPDSAITLNSRKESSDRN
jgi:hypothetical protein